MRVFFLVLILKLNVQSFTKASDIRDFEIEGMSIGDSLLDFFSENEIKKQYLYKSDEYYLFASTKYSSENYDGVQFHVKKNDKKYIIAAIEGIKLFEQNIKECMSLKNKIVNQLASLFKNVQAFDDSGDHSYDKTGNSKYYRTNFPVNPNAEYINVSVTCYDWSKKLETQFGDKLSVSISNDEFNIFTNLRAY